MIRHLIVVPIDQIVLDYSSRVYFLFCILISFGSPSYSNTLECKAVVFEVIGYCPEISGDVALMEMDPIQFSSFIRDESYTSDQIFAIHGCKDSLDLDQFYQILRKSDREFKFVKPRLLTNYSKGPKIKAASPGSLQIRVYDQSGFLIQGFSCEGMVNTAVWFDYIGFQCEKYRDFAQWKMTVFLNNMASRIQRVCAP